MEISFRKNTFTSQEIIEIAKLNNDFVIRDGSLPIVEFKKKVKYVYGGGGFEVFYDRDDKSPSNFVAIGPYTLNYAQKNYIKELVYSNFRVKICKYAIVNNEEEQKAWQSEIRGRSQEENLYKYPFIIGKEPCFVFQAKLKETFEDSIVYDRKMIYKYVKCEVTVQC